MGTFFQSTLLTRGVQVFAILLGIWITLDGWGSLAVAVPAAALAAWFGARYAAGEAYRVRLLRLAGFGLFFVVSSFRGALDVARRALHPDLPIEPHLERYPIGLPAGQPRTLLVSVVSLLPGTLSADLDTNDNTLLVHALAPGQADSVAELERRIGALFGLDLESGR